MRRVGVLSVSTDRWIVDVKRTNLTLQPDMAEWHYQDKMALDLVRPNYPYKRSSSSITIGYRAAVASYGQFVSVKCGDVENVLVTGAGMLPRRCACEAVGAS